MNPEATEMAIYLLSYLSAWCILEIIVETVKYPRGRR